MCWKRRRRRSAPNARGLLAELRRIAGVEAYASDANFILFRVATADQVFSGLKQRGVLIKNLHGTHPLLADCLRVTVGTPGTKMRSF